MSDIHDLAGRASTYSSVTLSGDSSGHLGDTHIHTQHIDRRTVLLFGEIPTQATLDSFLRSQDRIHRQQLPLIETCTQVRPQGRGRDHIAHRGRTGSARGSCHSSVRTPLSTRSRTPSSASSCSQPRTPSSSCSTRIPAPNFLAWTRRYSSSHRLEGVHDKPSQNDSPPAPPPAKTLISNGSDRSAQTIKSSMREQGLEVSPEIRQNLPAQYSVGQSCTTTTLIDRDFKSGLEAEASLHSCPWKPPNANRSTSNLLDIIDLLQVALMDLHRHLTEHTAGYTPFSAHNEDEEADSPISALTKSRFGPSDAGQLQGFEVIDSD